MRNVWKLAVPALLGGAAGGCLVKKFWLTKCQRQEERLISTEAERDLLYTWLLLEEKGILLTEFFEARGYHKLAILGMGRIGRLFFDAIQRANGPAGVVYGVEADHLGAVHEELTVYRLKDDPLPPADCVIICDLERVPEKLEAVRRGSQGDIVTLVEVLAWLQEQHKIEPRDGAIEGWPPKCEIKYE